MGVEDRTLAGIWRAANGDVGQLTLINASIAAIDAVNAEYDAALQNNGLRAWHAGMDVPEWFCAEMDGYVYVRPTGQWVIDYAPYFAGGRTIAQAELRHYDTWPDLYAALLDDYNAGDDSADLDSE